MFDKKDLEGVRARMERADKQRELLIKSSRDIIKLSKVVINFVHRDELGKAAPEVKRMTAAMVALRKTAGKETRLSYSGSFKAAEQEFVEAVAFYEVMKNKRLPKAAFFGVDDEHLILGLCDLPGELVRKAINSVIEERYLIAGEMHSLVTELYAELSRFSFLSGEMRKKYDSIKYDLKRLEDLVLELKLKGKI